MTASKTRAWRHILAGGDIWSSSTLWETVRKRAFLQLKKRVILGFGRRMLLQMCKRELFAHIYVRRPSYIIQKSCSSVIVNPFRGLSAHGRPARQEVPEAPIGSQLGRETITQPTVSIKLHFKRPNRFPVSSMQTDIMSDSSADHSQVFTPS